MRERMLQSKWYKVVLLFLLFSMIGGYFIQMILRGTGAGKPVLMTINGRDITPKEFEVKLAQEMERIAVVQEQYGPQAAESLLKLLGLDNPQEAALKALVQEDLLNQVADVLNLQLSQNYVMQKLQDPNAVVQDLRDVIPFQVIDQRGVINMPALKFVLERRGQTLADFETKVEEALKRKVVTDLVGTSVFVSTQEVKNYYTANLLARKYEVLRFPFDRYLKEVKAQPLTDKEVETFFAAENKAKKRYWIPEKRSGSVWTFSPEKYGITIADKDIESHYKTNKYKEFLDTPAQIKVRRILLKVDEGTNVAEIKEKALKLKEELDTEPNLFAQLAKEHSDDKETAEKGGIVEFFKRGDYDPAFERAAFRLKENDDISDIVATKEGLEILQRVERKRAVYTPLEKVRTQIAQLLREKKFKIRFSQDAQRAIDTIKEDTKAFDELVQKKQAVTKLIEKVERDASQLAQKLFKTKKGRWSFYLDEDGNGTILTVKEIEKTHESSLQSVRKSVETDVYRKKAIKALEADLKKAEELAAKSSLQQVKEQFEAELISTDWLKRDGEQQLQPLKKKGIPVYELFFVHDTVGSLTTAQMQDDGYLAKLESIEPFTEAVFEDKKPEITKDLMAEKKGLVIRGFVASLYKNATIKATEEHQKPGREIPLDDLVF